MIMRMLRDKRGRIINQQSSKIDRMGSYSRPRSDTLDENRDESLIFAIALELTISDSKNRYMRRRTSKDDDGDTENNACGSEWWIRYSRVIIKPKSKHSWI
jgi:hypothetical protein